MIYTFTPNPAVDYYIRIDHLETGIINRAEDHRYLPAGKGINVSKVLDLLGIPSTAVFFSGGLSGEFICRELNKFSLITPKPVYVEGVTRINVKVLADLETAINLPGPAIAEDIKEELLKWAEGLNRDDIIIISGSLPRNMDIEYIRKMGKAVNKTGARLILDVPNVQLKDLTDLEVYLIKPNFEEFQHLLQGREVTRENYRELIRQTAGGNIRNILLSLGPDGSYYCGEGGCYRIKSPHVEVYSTIGAGDTTLATFVGMTESGSNVEEALIYANAAGAAVVSNKDFDRRELIEELISGVELIKE